MFNELFDTLEISSVSSIDSVSGRQSTLYGHSFVVVGNSIAALTLVDVLSQKTNVFWCRRNGQVGGLFGGIAIDGELSDIGMTNFELGPLSEQPEDYPLSQYSHEATNSLRNHLGLVRNYLRQYCTLEQLPEPEMKVGNSVLPDFFFGHRLDILKQFQFTATQRDVLKCFPAEFHPNLKYSHPSPLDQKSYVDFCVDLFGELFTQTVITPWLRKLGVTNSAMISSPKHRSVWAPLYYPESVLSAIELGTTDLGLRANFANPVGTTIAGLVRSIRVVVEARSSVKVVDLEEISAEFLRELSFMYPRARIVVADRLKSNLMGPEQSQIDLLYFVAAKPKLNFSYVLNSHEECVPWYRLSRHGNIDSDSAVVCAEYPGNTVTSLEKLELLGIQDYVTAQDFKPLKLVRNMKALNLPDSDWDSFYSSQREDINRTNPNVIFIAGGYHRWSNTFSDQVIQAHQLVSEVEHDI